MTWLVSFFVTLAFMGFKNLGGVVVFNLCFLFPLIVMSMWEYASFYSLLNSWIAMDHVSLVMVLMSLMVLVFSLLCSVMDYNMKSGSSGFFMSLVILFCVLSFVSAGWMDFFFFFESSLVPTVYLILKWGRQKERIEASLYILMYTVSSSLPLLMVLAYLWLWGCSDSFLLGKMVDIGGYLSGQWVWVPLLAGFMVKIPVYGVHGWLPKAHVEAPLGGSMILSGVMLKLGGYGVFRLSWLVSMFSAEFIMFVVCISMVGSVMAGMMCVVQVDVKAIIAYSSVSHMGMSLAALLSFYSVGSVGAVGMMFFHGIVSPCLFALAGSLYDVTGSRNVMMLSGIGRSHPELSFYWFMVCAANMSVPPTLGYFSEMCCVGSLVGLSGFLGFVSFIVCVVTGFYSINLYCKVNHGSPCEVLKPFGDVSSRYFLSFFYMVVVMYSSWLYMDWVSVI